MCEHGTHIEVGNLLAFNPDPHRRTWKIDACLAPIVKALNEGGVETVQSCCGHGKTPGRIDLADGRILVVDFQALAQVGEINLFLKSLIDRLNKGRIAAMKTWPKGANGPIAIAAYETLVQDVEWVIGWLEAPGIVAGHIQTIKAQLEDDEFEHCDDCGRAYCDVYSLPDAVWARIHERAPAGLLCPTCALTRVVAVLDALNTETP